jgi:hypothetical protein
MRQTRLAKQIDISDAFWPPDRSVCAGLLIPSPRQPKAFLYLRTALRVLKSRKLHWGFAPARIAFNCTQSAAVLPAGHWLVESAHAIAEAKMRPPHGILSCWPTQSAAHFCAQRDEVHYFFSESGGLRHLAAAGAAVKSAAVCRVSFYKHARQVCAGIFSRASTRQLLLYP